MGAFISPITLFCHPYVYLLCRCGPYVLQETLVSATFQSLRSQ